MTATAETRLDPVSFETHPDRYRHWSLSIKGPVATLTMAVRENEPLRQGYQLRLNSYDLGVDIELADAVQRLRFEHPEVRCVVVTGGLDRVFCAGANIHMLASSTHGFKVNFCKLTNETRLSIEDASQESGQRYLAALGPDVLPNGVERIREQLPLSLYRRRQFASLFLDQHFVAGTGNHLRSEILFVAGLHPRLRPSIGRCFRCLGAAAGLGR